MSPQTVTERGRIERVEMNLRPGFHMIVTLIISICRLLIRVTSSMCHSRSPTVTTRRKPGLIQQASERKVKNILGIS